MFPQVHRGQSLLGSMLTLAASALVAVSAAGEAEARKGFGSSTFKSNSSSSSHSSSHESANASKRGENMHEEGKHADGKRDEPEADSADTGGGIGLKPSVSFGQDDDEAKKNEQAKDNARDKAEAPQSPTDGAKPAAVEKRPAAQTSRKKAVVERAPHPLAAGHTGMDVTVCEAGCVTRAEEPHVVYQQMTTRKAVENVGEMTPAASGGSAAAGDQGKDLIVCIGGCYDTPRIYATAQAKATAQQFEWKASVTPTSADGKAAGSGEWMRRIDATQGAKPGS